MAKAFLLLLAIGTAMPSLAQECQSQDGPWQSCALDWIDPGRRWDLRLQDEHWQISHDGSGTVQIREAGGEWVKAEPRWDSPGVLCWGPLCTRGPLPLD